jgi:GTPase SAR1 family protein
MDDNRTYKTVIIGDARVGKTSFMKCFLESEVAVLRRKLIYIHLNLAYF